MAVGGRSVNVQDGNRSTLPSLKCRNAWLWFYRVSARIVAARFSIGFALFS